MPFRIGDPKPTVGFGQLYDNEQFSTCGKLVAADVGEADAFEDVDAVDDPADLWFPVDGFKDTASGGRGDDVVGDALDLHFGSGEAGEIAGDVEFDAVGHGMIGWLLGLI